MLSDLAFKFMEQQRETNIPVAFCASFHSDWSIGCKLTRNQSKLLTSDQSM